MSKPPKVVIPGLNRGQGVPGGFVVGRQKGHGPAELLSLNALRRIGLATKHGVTQSTSQAVSTGASATASLSTGVSSSLSAGVSSTISLSSAVSTVISGSISAVNSRVDSLSTAVGGGGGVDDDTALSTSLSSAVSINTTQSTSLSQISSSLSGEISTDLSRINSLSTAIAGGGLTAPTVRASKIQSSSAASYALTWPTGTAADDIVLIMAGHGFAINTPSGWVVLNSTSASNWNGAVFAKQMTAADIVAGGVTLTTGGAFNGVIAQLTFTGVTGDIRQTAAVQDSTGASPRTVASSWTALTTDMVIAFGSNRNADAPTCDYGVQQQQINAAAASGVLNAASPGSNGTVTANFTYPTVSGTTGDYQVLIVVKGT